MGKVTKKVGSLLSRADLGHSIPIGSGRRPKGLLGKGLRGRFAGRADEGHGNHKPSLYATFGDKAELFRKVVDRYITKQNGSWEQVFREPSARRGARTNPQHCGRSLTSGQNRTAVSWFSRH